MSQENHIEKLEKEIRNSYGAVVYTYTTHLKEIDLLKKKNAVIDILSIILSAVSACGLFAVIMQWWPTVLAIATIILTTTDLCISVYSRSANLGAQISSHQATADKLWVIKAAYISLLTDLQSLEIEEIKVKRDELNRQTAEVYEMALKTTPKAYGMAQNALKNEEEQYFSNDEINAMLPDHLRK